LHRRLPKLRGFKRYYKLLKYYEPVNIGQLEADEKIESNEQVTKALLAQHGYLRKPTSAVKLLGRGELTKKLHFVDIDAVSASALTKIEQAGGSVSQVL
jgi:large subunit ribosomal protein L15